MGNLVGGLFSSADKTQFEALNQRLQRSHVLNSNIANAETPGYRAIGYDFEEQLQDAVGNSSSLQMKVSDSRHLRHRFASASGEISPDVYVRPTESISEDGNTVDVDNEMAKLAENEILYKTAVETINRKVGMLRYAINGGR